MIITIMTLVKPTSCLVLLSLLSENRRFLGQKNIDIS